MPRRLPRPTAERYNEPQATTIQTIAEQNDYKIIPFITNLLDGTDTGQANGTYEAIKYWWSNDIISNLFVNVGQLIGRWVTEWINGWISSTVAFLSSFLRTFVLNPNIAVNGASGILARTVAPRPTPTTISPPTFGRAPT